MSILAKILGYVGSGALIAGQALQHAGNSTAGLILTAIGAVLTGGGIHAASKSDGTN